MGASMAARSPVPGRAQARASSVMISSEPLPSTGHADVRGEGTFQVRQPRAGVAVQRQGAQAPAEGLLEFRRQGKGVFHRVHL
ncbi:hypothetical protein, partial [Azospirillum brasilense]|uniref:hypothetical protein n=1 Tax=Azospirillum brasilense TaxID=192 RepID=UPI001FFF79C3